MFWCRVLHTCTAANSLWSAAAKGGARHISYSLYNVFSQCFLYSGPLSDSFASTNSITDDLNHAQFTAYRRLAQSSENHSGLLQARLRYVVDGLCSEDTKMYCHFFIHSFILFFFTRSMS